MVDFHGFPIGKITHHLKHSQVSASPQVPRGTPSTSSRNSNATAKVRNWRQHRKVPELPGDGSLINGYPIKMDGLWMVYGKSHKIIHINPWLIPKGATTPILPPSYRLGNLQGSRWIVSPAMKPETASRSEASAGKLR